MKIAILGSSSKIARDLIQNFNKNYKKNILFLFARELPIVEEWILERGFNKSSNIVQSYNKFNEMEYDVIFNFVGIGDPRKLKELGSKILEISHYYDQLATNYLLKYPKTKYIFISSGAVYGSDNFNNNVTENSTQMNLDANKYRQRR